MTETLRDRDTHSPSMESPSSIPHAPTARRAVPSALLTGLAVCLLGVGYVALYLQRDWVPHDEGLLGQSAWRVLQGQWPHRDFVDTYTGGLSFLNALAFLAFGVKLTSLRLMLLLAATLWVPAVYWIGLRFLGPLGAALCAGLAVTWSIPTYSAAMPSWYNLFFATWAVAATMRYIETDRRRWLMVAGMMGGLSCLIKIVGLYLLLGIGLFLVYEAQGRGGAERRGGTRNLGYPLVVAAGAFLLTAAVARMTLPAFGATALYLFVVPIALLGLVLTIDAHRARVPSATAQGARLARLLLPFAVGALAPLAAFAAAFASVGGWSQLIHGVFIAPLGRLQFATFQPPALAFTMPALLLAAALGAATVSLETQARRVGTGIAALSAACVIGGGTILAYRWMFLSALEVLPPLAAIGAMSLLRRHAPDGIGRDRQKFAFLLLSAAVCCSLIAYPFGSPSYFFYNIPLVFLGAAAVLVLRTPPRRWMAITAAAYLAFAVVRMIPGTLRGMATSERPKVDWARLSMPRGGLTVRRLEASQYDVAMSLLRAHAKGRYTYAAPDAPEVYFLSGLENPTSTMFEFLDPSGVQTERVLESIRRHAVTAIAIKRFPRFSGPLPPALMDSLRVVFPDSASTDRFVIRWRS